MLVKEGFNSYIDTEQTRSLRQLTLRAGAALAITSSLLAGCGSSAKRAAAEMPPTRAANPPIPTEAVLPKPGPSVLVVGSHHREVEQFGAPTFTDYIAVSGEGPGLPKGGIVDVDCLAVGPVDAAPSARGKWYHISGPAQLAGYYAAANTFENGDTTGPLDTQPAVDLLVPACPKN